MANGRGSKGPQGGSWALPAMSQTLFQGQCALIVVCGCLAALYGFQRKILWLFLVGFLVASIKPQISLLVLGYIFLIGGTRWFIYGAVLTAAFSLLSLAIVPATNLFGAYQSSMGAHLEHQWFNQWSNYCGVPALFGGSPFGKQFMLIGVFLGILGTFWIALRQRGLADTLVNRLRHQQLLWIFSMATLPVHLYDLAGQVFITLTLWVLPDWRRRVLAFLCIFVGDKSSSVAHRLEQLWSPLAVFGPTLRLQGPSLMALALLVLFIYWYWHDYVRTGTRCKGTPA